MILRARVQRSELLTIGLEQFYHFCKAVVLRLRLFFDLFLLRSNTLLPFVEIVFEFCEPLLILIKVKPLLVKV